MNTQTPNSKNKIIIVTSIAGAIIIALVYFIFFNGDKATSSIARNPDTLQQTIDTLSHGNSVIAQDSIKAVNADIADDGESEVSYSDGKVVAASIQVAGRQLKFGDKVYLDDSKSNEKTVVFYLQDPRAGGGSAIYNADAAYFIPEYQFDEFKKNFSLWPFTSLPSAVKKLLLTDNYSDGNSYAITQNAERAKVATCSGDFDGDGLQDYAVIMDNNEKQISRIKVFCANAATKAFYVAYAENYTDKIKINSFKKGSKIFMDSEDLVESPLDGIILKGEDIKLALVYSRGLQKFKTYYQESASAVDDTAEVYYE